jgi:hypothetical protein
MAMLILAAVLPLRLGLGGGVSGCGVRSSSELSIWSIAQRNVAAFGDYMIALGGYTKTFADLRSWSSISKFSSYMAG